MFNSLLCEISQQFAKGFRPMEGMAVYELLNFEEPHVCVGYVTRYTHLTERNKPRYPLSSQQLSEG
jgi:hypothetical protein